MPEIIVCGLKEYLGLNRRALGGAYAFVTGWLEFHRIGYRAVCAGSFPPSLYSQLIRHDTTGKFILISASMKTIGLTPSMPLEEHEALFAQYLLDNKLVLGSRKSFHMPRSDRLTLT